MALDAWLYDAIRTPRGRAKDSGGLYDLTPHELLRRLYDALQARTALDPALIGDVVLGCVTQHGEQAGNIAKTSALYAGWPASVGGITVNRFCSSSIDAINFAALKVASGQEQAVVAGGVEMMSRVPMLSDAASVFADPAYAARCHMLLMGSGADLIASLNGVTREQADAVALQSQQRAAAAQAQGYFRSVIAIDNPVKGMTVARDECVRPDTTAQGLAAMPAAFAQLGVAGADAIQLAAHDHLEAIEHIHTAGNSPAMADAAALLLLGSQGLGDTLGIEPRARVVAATVASDDPLQVLTGCIAATARLLREQGLGVDDVDLFEIHEAFAATMVVAQRDLGIAADRLNVNGGVIALGHPMGATGAIMTLTLLDELERRGLKRGIVAASGAGGSGSALLIERLV
ncbi:MAG: acetyl-CoA C-acyltransferase [Halioglobus sp.]|nr:acetyl-CoA C-acyltransferase [Halioglobus sp.]